MRVNDLTGMIIGAAIEVHRSLGPGLLESAYQECLCRELTLRGIRFRRQVPIPLEYKGIRLEKGYQLDVLVENAVVVEIKAIEAIHPIFEAQTLTYMRLGGWKVGLLLNFNVEILKKASDVLFWIWRITQRWKFSEALSALPLRSPRLGGEQAF